MSTNETGDMKATRVKLGVQVPPTLQEAVGLYFRRRARLRRRAGGAVLAGELKGYSHGLAEAICWFMNLSDDDIERIVAEGGPLLKELVELDPGYSGPLPWGQRSGSVFCPDPGPGDARRGQPAGGAVIADARPSEEQPRRRGKGKERAVAQRDHAPARKA